MILEALPRLAIAASIVYNFRSVANGLR